MAISGSYATLTRANGDVFSFILHTDSFTVRYPSIKLSILKGSLGTSAIGFNYLDTNASEDWGVDIKTSLNATLDNLLDSLDATKETCIFRWYHHGLSKEHKMNVVLSFRPASSINREITCVFNYTNE